MYHIKDDVRALKSAEQLYKGLSSCMKEKDFAKLTVAEVSKASAIGRATFYRNFDDLVDILLWKCDSLFSKMFHSLSVRDILQIEKVGFILYTFRYWERHSDVLAQLLSIGRTDVIFVSFIRNAEVISEYRQKLGMPPIADFDFFISARAGLFVGMMSTWIKNGKKESAGELAEILTAQLNHLT